MKICIVVITSIVLVIGVANILKQYCRKRKIEKQIEEEVNELMKTIPYHRDRCMEDRRKIEKQVLDDKVSGIYQDRLTNIQRKYGVTKYDDLYTLAFDEEQGELYMYFAYSSSTPYLFVKKKGDELEIVDIYAKTESGSRGYGTIMLSYIIDWAKKNGFQRIKGQLSSKDEKDEQNELCRNAFYKKMGFELQPKEHPSRVEKNLTQDVNHD